MRRLGMFAFFLTIGVVLLNVLWFGRHGLGLGAFLRLTWPVAAGAAGLIAISVALGFASARLLQRVGRGGEDGAGGRETEAEAVSEAEGEAAEERVPQKPGKSQR